MPPSSSFTKPDPTSVLPGLLLLTTVFYFSFFSRIIFAPLLPAIEKNLALTHGEAGLFFLILSTGYFISLICSGFISSWLSHKKTIAFSMVATGASLLLIAAFTHLFWLRLSFFLLGLSSGIYLPSAISTISHLFSSRHWGRAFAVHELAPNLAFLSAPLFASLFLPAAHWQVAILLLAGATFSSAVVYYLFGKGDTLFGEPPKLALCTRIIVQKDFLILILLFAFGITGTIGVFNVLPLFLVNNHAMTTEYANLLVGLSRFSSLFTALLGGWLADRFGNRKTIAGVLLLTGITTLCLGVADGNFLVLMIFLQPLLAVCFFPAGFALLSKLSTEETRNVVISLVVPLAFVIGGGLIPALITFMADFNLFDTGLIITGLLISAPAVLVVQLRK